MAFRSQLYVHLYAIDLGTLLKRQFPSGEHDLEKHTLVHFFAGSGDVTEESSLLVSKRGDVERLTELAGCCLRRSGVAKVEFL